MFIVSRLDKDWNIPRNHFFIIFCQYLQQTQKTRVFHGHEYCLVKPAHASV